MVLSYMTREHWWLWQQMQNLQHGLIVLLPFVCFLAGQCMGVMAAHTSWVSIVRFLPDGKKAITASHDGTAR